MTATFSCGHKVRLTGNETSPRCHCGSTRIVDVAAPKPSFRGIVKGPRAQFEDLPPRPASWSR